MLEVPFFSWLSPPFWPMSTKAKLVPLAKIVALLWTKMARKVEADKK